MLIVIEGCDGSGKTTLVQQLIEDRRLPYFVVVTGARASRATLYEMQFELNWLNRHSPGQRIICDRHRRISECIYGPAYGRPAVWDDHMVVDHVLREVDVLIYCRPDSQVIADNVRRTPQMEGVVDRTPDLIRRYDALMNAIDLRLNRCVLDAEATRTKTYHYDYLESSCYENLIRFFTQEMANA